MTGLILSWTIFGFGSVFDDSHAVSSLELKKEEKSITLNDLTPRRQFKVAPYVRAAALLQEMGKEKACKQLMKLAKMDDEDGQVAVLCRLLFSKKENKEFLAPLFGAPHYMGATSDGDWPLSPIEIVDDVPFFIVSGYDLGGLPLPSFAYLNYCLENCEWSKSRFRLVNDKTIEKALERLLASKKWRRPLTNDERQRLIFQTK